MGLVRFLGGGFLLLLLSSCGKIDHGSGGADCAPRDLPTGLGDTGRAAIFTSDPISQTGQDVKVRDSIENLREDTTLTGLIGRGVLASEQVYVTNDLTCKGGFGAFSETQNFTYERKDAHYSEAAAFYHSDRYLSFLNDAKVALFPSRLLVSSPCMLEDNAFHQRYLNKAGKIQNQVCVGISKVSPGLSYAEDGQVMAHEIQHGNTTNTYSLIAEFNGIANSEAAALNEAISDVMSLVYFQPFVNAALDPRVFSRWAMGKYFGQTDYSRGAYRCPPYSPTFPRCDAFKTARGFDIVQAGEVSYRYPDGLGWPHLPATLTGTGIDALTVLTSRYSGWDRPHSASAMGSGFLWDIFEAVGQDRVVFAQLIHRALTQLPMPTPRDRSPIGWLVFASALQNVAGEVVDPSSVDALERVTREWGFVGHETLPDGWAKAGDRVIVEDRVAILQEALVDGGLPVSIAAKKIDRTKQRENQELSPGELAQVWFEIANEAEATAASIKLWVRVEEGPVEIVDEELNVRVLDSDGKSAAQVVLQKLNGRSLVAGLQDSRGRRLLPLGRTSLTTWGLGTLTHLSGVWVRVKPEARVGDRVKLRVEAQAGNGPEALQELFYETQIR